jgi:hypothetical protein
MTVKPDVLICQTGHSGFSRMSNLVINTWIDSLMFFLPFSMLQTYLDLQIFMFSSFSDPILKLQKPDTPVYQIGQSGFFSLAKFDHQHMPPTF